jgi:Methyltransferase domain
MLPNRKAGRSRAPSLGVANFPETLKTRAIQMLLRVIKDLLRNRNTPPAGDILHHARQLLGRSRPEEAIEVLSILLKHDPHSVEALILSGSAKREAGRASEALSDLAKAITLAPDDPEGLYEMAAASYVSGDRRLAGEYCRLARRVAPEFTKPFALLAQLKLEGVFYLDVLARILDYVKPRTYVEIGIFQGDSLRLAKPPALAIGIDPNPQLTRPLAGNQRVFAKTSDAFFATHDLRAEFGGLPVDLAFIDGMHHFEYALRDFANLERNCARGSTILIHDCYPVDRESAERAPRDTNWSGDIWRLIVLLKKYRPDLSVRTIGAPPTGLGFVRNLDPASRYLFDHHDQLCEEFLALDYSYLDTDMEGKLSLIPTDWEQIRAALDYPSSRGEAPA